MRALVPAGFLLMALVGVIPAGPVPVLAPDDLVLVQEGEIPLLLTAAHGGAERIPGVPARTSGTTAQDAWTRELASMVAAELQALVCGRPYVVVALFHRRYLDANRPAADAFEHPDAAPYYAAYHDAVLRAIRQLRTSAPMGGLLVDIHGQAEDPDVIHRGTRDGRTVSRFDAVIGERGVFTQLQAAGYRVFPPNTSPGQPPEDRRFNGGYTVATYGSSSPEGIDAIQIEIGSGYRQPEALPRLASDLARALATAYRAHLAPVVRCAATLPDG